MSKAAQKMSQESAQMDMTPMIDVVFNLLIFFMVVTDLQQKDLAKLTLPIAHMAEEDKDNDPDDRVILNIDTEGHILYKGRPRSLEEIGGILREEKKRYDFDQKRNGKSGLEPIPGGGEASKLFVLLRADKETPWQHVQWLMTIMAEQKLYKMQFATKKFISGGGYEAGEAESLGGMSAKDYQKLTGKEAK
jgi:biopolymer transport protein ExbD